jgi:hypothetical protein
MTPQNGTAWWLCTDASYAIPFYLRYFDSDNYICVVAGPGQAALEYRYRGVSRQIDDRNPRVSVGQWHSMQFTVDGDTITVAGDVNLRGTVPPELLSGGRFAVGLGRGRKVDDISLTGKGLGQR